MDKIYSAIEKDGWKSYDAFIDLVKNAVEPTDNDKAYKVEDYLNKVLSDAFEAIEKGAYLAVSNTK